MTIKYIYGLISPLTNKIFYIGQTNDLSRRMSEHLLDDSGSYKSLVIQDLRKMNLVFSIIILQEVDENFADVAEANWINVCLAAGIELTNTASPATSPIQPKKVRLIDSFSLEFNTNLVGQTILHHTFGISRIYRFSEIVYVIFKNGDYINYVPKLSNEDYDRVISILRIEASSKQERELVSFIEKRIAEIIKKGCSYLTVPIHDISDDDSELIRADFVSKMSSFKYLIEIIHTSLYNPTLLNIFDSFNTISNIFDIFIEFQNFAAFCLALEKNFDNSFPFIKELQIR